MCIKISVVDYIYYGHTIMMYETPYASMED